MTTDARTTTKTPATIGPDDDTGRVRVRSPHRFLLAALTALAAAGYPRGRGGTR